MANYTVLRLTCDGLEQAVNLKLNEEDGFVRIGGPYYELLYLNKAPLDHTHVVASNVYGMPQFHLHYHHYHEAETVNVKWNNHRQFNVQFSTSEPQKVVCLAKTGDSNPMSFALQYSGALSIWEKQMIASAVAWITLHKAEFSLLNRNGILSSQIPDATLKPQLA